MTKQSAYELLIGAAIMVVGAAIEAFSPPWYPVGWMIGVFVLLCGVCLWLDAVIWPYDPPNPTFLGLMAVAAGLYLSP